MVYLKALGRGPPQGGDGELVVAGCSLGLSIDFDISNVMSLLHGGAVVDHPISNLRSGAVGRHPTKRLRIGFKGR